MKKTIALSAIGAMALAGNAYSQESSISTDFAVSYNTDYVFRGINFGDDLFTYGLDVAGSCDCGFDWSAGVWYANYSTGATGPSGFNADEEIDIYGAISKDFGNFNVEVGFIQFIFPDTDNGDNTEVYTTVSTALAGIDLYGSFYWNLAADDGATVDAGDIYWELGASYDLDLTEKLSASAGVTLGFIGTDVAPAGSGFAHVTLNLGLSYAVSENVSVDPYIAYSNADSDYVTGFNDGSSNDNFYGGVSVGFSF